MENYEPDPSDAVSAVAEASGREAAEVAYDMMCHSKDGSSALGCLWRPVFANRPDGTCKCSRSLCVFFRSLKDAAAQTIRVWTTCTTGS